MAVKTDSNNEIQLRSSSKAGTLVGVLLILVAVAGYIFFTKGVSDEVASARTDLEVKQGEVDTLEAEIEALESAEEELGLTSEVTKIDLQRAIPLGLNQDEVIRDVIEISENNDIELRSLTFGQGVSEQDGIGALRVNASFEGNYSDLINFLEGVEQNARLLVVNSINVQLATLAISGIERANFSLSMEAFFQQ